jgi:hypothetical protein
LWHHGAHDDKVPAWLLLAAGRSSRFLQRLLFINAPILQRRSDGGDAATDARSAHADLSFAASFSYKGAAAWKECSHFPQRQIPPPA